MVVHSVLDIDDYEILRDFCKEHNTTVSAILKTLAVDFLDTTDKDYVNYIVSEAQKIKQGRPKEY